MSETPSRAVPGAGLRRVLATAAATALVLTAVVVGTTAVARAGPSGTAGWSAGAAAKNFDLEGHRGTRGLRPEDTLPAFAEALTLGVRTLELDTGITGDGVVIVSHERLIAPLVCVDTRPAWRGDPNYPYVGKYYHQLTFAEVETVDCGSRHPTDPASDPFYASQLPVPGTRIPTLDQVFDLVEQRHATGVQLNIETKIDPTHPDQTVDPVEFVRADLAVIGRHRGGMARSLLQSFDWRTLAAARELAPELRRVALINADTAQIGQPGASPWLGGIDIDAPSYHDDPATAASSVGATVLSPDHTFLTDQTIASAHRQHQLVVPYTVDDDHAMIDLIRRGVDGLITDYPNRGRDVLASLGVPLPPAYPA